MGLELPAEKFRGANVASTVVVEPREPAMDACVVVPAHACSLHQQCRLQPEHAQLHKTQAGGIHNFPRWAGEVWRTEEGEPRNGEVFEIWTRAFNESYGARGEKGVPAEVEDGQALCVLEQLLADVVGDARLVFTSQARERKFS